MKPKNLNLTDSCCETKINLYKLTSKARAV